MKSKFCKRGGISASASIVFSTSNKTFNFYQPKRVDIISPLGVRHYPGAGLKELKTRIATIQSITKVTNSMKMIASAKLTKQQERLQEAIPFRNSSIAFINHEYPPLDPTDEFYIDKKEAEESEEVANELVVAITSDRGLCGGVNSNISKEVAKMMKKKPNAQLVLVGDKSVQQLQREFGSKIALTLTNVSGNKPITFHECAAAVDLLAVIPFEKITLIYNSFKSVITYNVLAQKFPGQDKVVEDEKRHQPFVTDPDHEVMLRSAYQYTLASFLFGAITESQTCEIAGRMTAMENATTNGRDLIKTLSLQYNKERQQAITTELVEIVSGASAVDEQLKKDRA